MLVVDSNVLSDELKIVGDLCITRWRDLAFSQNRKKIRATSFVFSCFVLQVWLLCTLRRRCWPWSIFTRRKCCTETLWEETSLCLSSVCFEDLFVIRKGPICCLAATVASKWPISARARTHIWTSVSLSLARRFGWRQKSLKWPLEELQQIFGEFVVLFFFVSSLKRLVVSQEFGVHCDWAAHWQSSLLHSGLYAGAISNVCSFCFLLVCLTRFFQRVDDPHPPLPANLSPQCKDFLLKCFVKDFNKRPTATQVCSSLFLFVWFFQRNPKSFSITSGLCREWREKTASEFLLIKCKWRCECTIKREK